MRSRLQRHLVVVLMVTEVICVFAALLYGDSRHVAFWGASFFMTAGAALTAVHEQNHAAKGNEAEGDQENHRESFL